MRSAALVLCLLTACSTVNPPPPDGPLGPIEHRVLTEGENREPCVESPSFEIAIDEDSWITVVDRQSECLEGGEIDLPSVDFEKEFVVAAWWRRFPCSGAQVDTVSVQRRTDEIVITATTATPTPCEGGPEVQVESFLALEWGPFAEGAETFTFVLDGLLIERVPV